MTINVVKNHQNHKMPLILTTLDFTLFASRLTSSRPVIYLVTEKILPMWIADAIATKTNFPHRFMNKVFLYRLDFQYVHIYVHTMG